jgi:hypothetical protein
MPASAAMSRYLQECARATHRRVADPLESPSAEEVAHAAELFDFAFGYSRMLLLAHFARLLSATKSYFNKGRTYRWGLLWP